MLLQSLERHCPTPGSRYRHSTPHPFSHICRFGPFPFKHRRIILYLKYAACQHFAGSYRKRQAELFPGLNRSVASLNADNCGLQRIRIGDFDLGRFRQVDGDWLTGFAPNRRRCQRHDRLGHFVDWLHVKHQLEELARANGDFAVGGGKAPAAGTDAFSKLQVRSQPRTLHLYRLQHRRVICECHREAVRRKAHRVVHRNDDLDILVSKRTRVVEPNTGLHLDIYGICRNTL